MPLINAPKPAAPTIAPTLEILRLHTKVPMPRLAYSDSAAYDLCAWLLTEEGRPNNAIVSPRSTRLIGTGLCFRPPEGHLVLICSRSGLAAKQSIFVANAPGVVDPSYTGEIKVALYNGGHQSHYVRHLDCIAQALIVPFSRLNLLEVDSFPTSLRGDRGFGSSDGG